jgi:hypothetical protein
MKMSRSILKDQIAEFQSSLKSEEIEMNKQLLIIMCLSILFAFFLIAYLMVWLSGDFDDSQYVDTYRVLVSGGLVLSYNALKITEEDI